MTTTSVNQFTSSIFLMIMSADRYIAICHPISSSKVRTAYVSKIVSVTAWTFSIILMIPVIMYANTMDKGNVMSCNIIWPENDLFSGQTAFTLYSFVLGFAIPLMLIFVFYILVIRKLQTVRICVFVHVRVSQTGFKQVQTRWGREQQSQQPPHRVAAQRAARV